MGPLLAAAALVLIADTQPDASRYWYNECSKQTLTCHGYIRGVFEATQILAGKTGTKLVCAPDQFSASSMATYMVKTMNEPGNEELKSISFSGLVIAALESSYPCQ